MNQSRQPAGRPTGGQYAATERAEAPVSLSPIGREDQDALKALEAARDRATKPEAKAIVQQLIDNPHRAAYALLKVAAYLGSNEEWDSEMLEGIATDCGSAGLPRVGDQTEEALRGYRELADQFGYSHDGPEDDEDDDACADCGEPLDDGEGYDGYCGNCADKLEAAGRWD